MRKWIFWRRADRRKEKGKESRLIPGRGEREGFQRDPVEADSAAIQA
jgi:hypothetical protein